MAYTHTLITVKEAAQMLGLAEKTVHNRRGGTYKLTRIRRGRSVRMIRKEVEQHVESLINAGQRRHGGTMRGYRREYDGLSSFAGRLREEVGGSAT
jgi:predicted DNA-binding transcriptional regulator AlpA